MLGENDSDPFAHEAGVYIEDQNALFITSNRLTNPSTGVPEVKITKVLLRGATCEEVNPSEPIPMANGGVNYNDGIPICVLGYVE